MVDLSVVVPCYNEEDGIPQLREKLLPVLAELRPHYDIELILIDDGSTDSTYEKLKASFTDAGSRVIKHEKNQNLGGAIRTGMQSAQGKWVAFLDSDCTYDPKLLKPMLDQMKLGADVVTLSPYHPQGQVEGVAAYRMVLSKGLSLIYRIILGKPVFTYTAMARIYNRSVYPTIKSPANDFTSVAEMMLKALKQDLKVSEVPAVLSVRQFGESKMKTARIIRAHLNLIKRLIVNPSSYKQ